MLTTFEHVYESGTLIMETGQLALQANGAVLVKQGDCALLVAATMSKPREGHRLLPPHHRRGRAPLFARQDTRQFL